MCSGDLKTYSSIHYFHLVSAFATITRTTRLITNLVKPVSLSLLLFPIPFQFPKMVTGIRPATPLWSTRGQVPSRSTFQSCITRKLVNKVAQCIGVLKDNSRVLYGRLRRRSYLNRAHSVEFVGTGNNTKRYLQYYTLLRKCLEFYSVIVSQL